MPKHETKACPRCGGDFECRVGTIQRCHCADLAIDSEVAEQLALTYGDCLCRACLEAVAVSDSEPAPA